MRPRRPPGQGARAAGSPSRLLRVLVLAVCLQGRVDLLPQGLHLRWVREPLGVCRGRGCGSEALAREAARDTRALRRAPRSDEAGSRGRALGPDLPLAGHGTPGPSLDFATQLPHRGSDARGPSSPRPGYRGNQADVPPLLHLGLRSFEVDESSEPSPLQHPRNSRPPPPSPGTLRAGARSGRGSARGRRCPGPQPPKPPGPAGGIRGARGGPGLSWVSVVGLPEPVGAHRARQFRPASSLPPCLPGLPKAQQANVRRAHLSPQQPALGGIALGFTRPRVWSQPSAVQPDGLGAGGWSPPLPAYCRLKPPRPHGGSATGRARRRVASGPQVGGRSQQHCPGSLTSQQVR